MSKTTTRTRSTSSRHQDAADRLQRGRRSRFAVVPLGALFIGAFSMALFVIPMRTWSKQRTTITQRNEQFSAFEDINDALQDEVDGLKTPQGAQEAIRSQLGYLLPSEKRVPLLAAPTATVDLPDRWPYTLVINILQIRSAQAVRDASVGVLDPLQP